jgi:hypothetical protein
MGGKGSGGPRVGAGRKPWKKDAAVYRGQGADAAVAAPIVTRPAGMSAAVARVWDALAPLAEREGTLVVATAFEFLQMCQLAVQQGRAHTELEAAKGDDWLRIEKAYRGLTQRLETKLRSFKLAPMGKEIIPVGASKPKSALERLREQGLHAVK